MSVSSASGVDSHSCSRRFTVGVPPEKLTMLTWRLGRVGSCWRQKSNTCCALSTGKEALSKVVCGMNGCSLRVIEVTTASVRPAPGTQTAWCQQMWRCCDSSRRVAAKVELLRINSCGYLLQHAMYMEAQYTCTRMTEAGHSRAVTSTVRFGCENCSWLFQCQCASPVLMLHSCLWHGQ